MSSFRVKNAYRDPKSHAVIFQSSPDYHKAMIKKKIAQETQEKLSDYEHLKQDHNQLKIKFEHLEKMVQQIIEKR